jgi:hypothetical protein
MPVAAAAMPTADSDAAERNPRLVVSMVIIHFVSKYKNKTSYELLKI